jgi:hypothetical protein
MTALRELSLHDLVAKQPNRRSTQGSSYAFSIKIAKPEANFQSLRRVKLPKF